MVKLNGLPRAAVERHRLGQRHGTNPADHRETSGWRMVMGQHQAPCEPTGSQAAGRSREAARTPPGTVGEHGSMLSRLVRVASSQGLPTSSRSLVRHHFKRLLPHLSLPDISLYDLRHTAATLAFVAVVPPRVVFEQLGHVSATLIPDVYSRAFPQMQDAAAAKVEAHYSVRSPDSGLSRPLGTPLAHKSS